MKLTLRVLADLAIAGVRQHLDGELVVWAAAGTLDSHGAGRAEVAVLRRLFWRARLRRAMRAGLFRGEGHGWYYRASIARVAELLGVERPRAAGFKIPLNMLTTGAALRRARLVLGSIAAIRRGKPISISAIASEVGVSERTVYTWLKISRWPRRRRFALQPTRVTSGTLRWVRAVQPGPYLVLQRRGRLRLARRLPNVIVAKYTIESRQSLARRLRTARPASSATQAPRDRPTGHDLPSSKTTARAQDLPSFPAGSVIPNCQREGEVFVRGAGAS